MLPFLEPGALAIHRQAVPDKPSLAQAQEALAQRFAAKLAAAKTRPARAALVAELLAASEAADAAPDQYAALVRARELAVAAGDPATLLKTVDELARWFEVDAWQLKSQALAAAVAASTRQTTVPLGETALKLAAEAAADKPDAAAALAQTAASAAIKARDVELNKRARALREELSKSKSAKSTASPRPNR